MYGGSTQPNSLVTPALAALAEDSPNQVDGVAFDLFLIELVNTLRQSSRIATTRLRQQEDEMIAAGLLPAPPPVPALPPGVKVESKIAEEEEEALRVRLESIGATVGGNIAERLSKDKTRFQDTLDTIKFICKDLWTVIWDKQVDNLRTNHRGVYVLQDNAFKPLMRLSSPSGAADALRKARIYLAFSVGVIRGALARFGLNAVVTGETLSLPACTFNVKLPKGQ